MTTMRHRTNTIEDFITRAGVMRTLAHYYTVRNVPNGQNYARQCLAIRQACLAWLLRHRVRFVQFDDGRVKFLDPFHQELYKGIRPLKETRDYANG